MIWNEKMHLIVYHIEGGVVNLTNRSSNVYACGMSYSSTFMRTCIILQQLPQERDVYYSTKMIDNAASLTCMHCVC